MHSVRFVFSVVLLLLTTWVGAQENQPLRAGDFFPKERAKVLVVGTFHFEYPGLDAHQTTDENKIDVLREPKLSELEQMVEYIKKFKPNKIAIEAIDSWNAQQKYAEYCSGSYRDKRDERFTLGMRIGMDLGVDSIHSVDAGSMLEDLQNIDPGYVDSLFRDFDFKSDDPYTAMMKEWYKAEDKLTVRMHLLDYFKMLNSLESHQYAYGAYLIGDFKLENTRGADVIASWWYNRNLRIFRKIQDINTGPDDRILVIIGNGHAAVLRQLFECSPEFEFVPFDGLE